jgi:hypothetical protein
MLFVFILYRFSSFRCANLLPYIINKQLFLFIDANMYYVSDEAFSRMIKAISHFKNLLNKCILTLFYIN